MTPQNALAFLICSGKATSSAADPFAKPAASTDTTTTAAAAAAAAAASERDRKTAALPGARAQPHEPPDTPDTPEPDTAEAAFPPLPPASREAAFPPLPPTAPALRVGPAPTPPRPAHTPTMTGPHFVGDLIAEQIKVAAKLLLACSGSGASMPTPSSGGDEGGLLTGTRPALPPSHAAGDTHSMDAAAAVFQPAPKPVLPAAATPAPQQLPQRSRKVRRRAGTDGQASGGWAADTLLGVHGGAAEQAGAGPAAEQAGARAEAAPPAARRERKAAAKGVRANEEALEKEARRLGLSLEEHRLKNTKEESRARRQRAKQQADAKVIAPGMCIAGCGFHGSPEFGGMCSRCSKQKTAAPGNKTRECAVCGRAFVGFCPCNRIRKQQEARKQKAQEAQEVAWQRNAEALAQEHRAKMTQEERAAMDRAIYLESWYQESDGSSPSSSSDSSGDEQPGSTPSTGARSDTGAHPMTKAPRAQQSTPANTFALPTSPESAAAPGSSAHEERSSSGSLPRRSPQEAAVPAPAPGSVDAGARATGRDSTNVGATFTTPTTFTPPATPTTPPATAAAPARRERPEGTAAAKVKCAGCQLVRDAAGPVAPAAGGAKDAGQAVRRCERCQAHGIRFPFIPSAANSNEAVVAELSSIAAQHARDGSHGLSSRFCTFALETLVTLRQQQATDPDPGPDVWRRKVGLLTQRADAHRMNKEFKLGLWDAFSAVRVLQEQQGSGAHAAGNVDGAPAPSAVGCWTTLAKCAASYGEVYQSEQACHEVLRLDPGNAFATQGLAHARTLFAQEHTAMDKLFGPSEEHGGAPRSFRGLCKFLGKHVEQYTNGEASRPLLRLIQLYAHIESVHAKSRYTASAAEHYIDGYIGKDPRFHYVAARFLLAQGNLDKAVQQLTTALEFNKERSRNVPHAAPATQPQHAHGHAHGHAHDEGWLHRSIDTVVDACRQQLHELKACYRLKQAGKKEFKAGKFQQACDKYTSTLRAMSSLGLRKVEARLHFNKAMCFNQLGLTDAAIVQCDVAIQYDSKYTKASARVAT